MSEDKKYFSMLGFLAFLAFLSFLALIMWQIHRQAQSMITPEEIEKAREIARRMG